MLAAGVDARQSAAEKNAEPRPLIALDPRWTVPFETAPAAPAGYDEHAAYVPLKGGELVAVMLENGAVRWKVELVTAFTPATGDGFVFAAGDGMVLAFEDRTGATAWHTPVGGELAAPAYFDAGLLFVSRTDGELVALRAEDGTVVWRQALGAPLAVAPSVAGDHLYVGLKDGSVSALNRDTGEPLWTFSVGAAVTGMLALADQVLVGTRGNRIYSFHPHKPRVRWQWRVGADIAGAPVADEKRIYFAALDNVLRAVDRRNGNLRWTAPLPSRPSGGPLRTGDVVIVPTVSANIGAYLAETGKESFTITAAGELGGVPFLRETPRPTAPRLVAMNREGTLQGFAPRHEPPPRALAALPGGGKVGGI
jgi:outer membrane protein assembly factor BamB